MGKLFYAIAKSARPRQWLKNLALFASVIFTGQLFNASLFAVSIKAFIIFCAIASSNYLFNDVMDAKKDRKHPFKKLRPVASGALPVSTALATSATLLLSGLIISFTVNPGFFAVAVSFALLSYSYTLFFKHFVLIDILIIALGYFLRVFAGEAATGFHLSVWLSLAVFSLSIFLAVGKRRAELTLIQNFKGTVPRDTRTTLLGYSERLLDTYTAMFANSTWITYAFYTFLERPPTSTLPYRYFILEFLSPNRKWLMATIPLVLFGIMRYMQLIYEGKGESPEQILTSDLPLLTTVLVWGLFVIGIIYGIGG